MTTVPEGIDAPKVGAWLQANVAGATGPFTYQLIAGGHSNLTYRVDDGAGVAYVLRRPPLGHVLASAHDMGREHRIISALGPTAVPVAPALGYCDDPDVNGAPFYVMGFVEGHIVRDAHAAEEVLDQPARRRAGESLVDVLAEIHAVDVDAVGLGDLSRKEGYIARQLKRWLGQWQQSKTRELPEVERAHAVLSARIPEQGAAAVVHGDYRLDNCMIGGDGEVRAVLDWEICTLGDPLADLGLLLVYWTEPTDPQPALLGAPTLVPGFPTRAELVERYAAASGRDLGDLDFYLAFGYWKLACIIEGVYARYLHGAMGQVSEDRFIGFKRQVEFLATRAAEVADSLAPA